MKTRTFLVLTIVCGVAMGTAVACGDDSSSGSNNNSFIPCEGIEDCPPGYECVSNVCVADPDGGVEPDASTDPDIEVDPTELDFGNPLLNVAVEQTLTITNVGGADLTIFSIVLEEDDATHEYDATPLGNLALVLAPGASVEVDVQLVNIDDHADTGRLVINSNDLDESMTTVPLVSELKGDGLVGTCVMETADMYNDCVTNPEIIDFGQLPSDATVLQDVSLFNAGTGNTPLVVQDIYVTNNSGYVSQFQLDVKRFVEDPANPGTYMEETIADLTTNPYLLEVNDGEGAPEVLLIHVRFDALAALEGQPVPPEFLVIQTDDASHPNVQIPFAGNIDCPEDWWELDGVSPWCEYECTVTNGGIENCDNLDNNCDGVIDEGCPVCGNGVVETGETCDDGNHNNTDDCPDGIGGSCEPAVCGDGHVHATNEECDDGNHDNTDGCLDDTANGGACEDAVCGDGFVFDGVETCDDGNHNNTDDCPDGVSGTCDPATCGDGFVHATAEECDDGAANSNTIPDACRPVHCVLASCGDGVIDTDEECEPPNTSTCDDQCQDISGGPLDPNGCYMIFPAPAHTCAFGYVEFSFSCTTFTVFGGTNITVTTNTNSTHGQPCPMSGNIDAAGVFSATCTLYGDCDEIYTISGTFTDSDNWTGTFTSNYVENVAGGCGGCTSPQWNLTGQTTSCPCP